jgi:hypothetical protein
LPNLREMVDSGLLDVSAASRPVSKLEEGMNITEAVRNGPGKPVQKARDGVAYPTNTKFSGAPVRDKAREMEVEAEDDGDDDSGGDDDEDDVSAGPVQHIAKNQALRIQDIEDDTADESYDDNKPKRR